MADIIYGLSQDNIFARAVDFLKKKKSLTRDEYMKLSDEARAKAFTVAGYTKAEVLDTFLGELTKAVEDGQTKEMFMQNMNSFLERNGYAAMNPWKSDTIFRTNVQTAFNAGHYQTMSSGTAKKLRPYWMYMTAGDGSVRESHMAMQGKVYRADDPIWDIWYPPNGFRCRCSVVSLSKHQLEQKGLKVSDDAPYNVDRSTGEMQYIHPDKGFSNNSAKDSYIPDVGSLSPAVRKIYQENVKQAK